MYIYDKSFVKLQDLKKKMESDAEAIDQMEEAKKRIQRELDEKGIQLEEKAAYSEKVSLVLTSEKFIFHEPGV